MNLLKGIFPGFGCKPKDGLLKGPSHKRGGIKAVIKETAQPIELEGDEVVINKKAVKKKGRKIRVGTNEEILHDINTETGGNPILEKGGYILTYSLNGSKKRLKKRFHTIKAGEKFQEKYSDKLTYSSFPHRKMDMGGNMADNVEKYRPVLEKIPPEALLLKKGGGINKKSKFIQNAHLKKGALRKLAKEEGAIDKNGNINKKWLDKKAKEKGTVGKRARLAKTLEKLPHHHGPEHKHKSKQHGKKKRTRKTSKR